MWLNRSDTNRLVQAQKSARSLKFWIYIEEELYSPSSEIKGADQLRSYCEADLLVTAKLICAFVFAYADCWFSHGAAHFFLNAHNIPQKLTMLDVLLYISKCMFSKKGFKYCG